MSILRDMPILGSSIHEIMELWEREVIKDKKLRKNTMDDLIDETRKFDTFWAIGDRTILFNDNIGRKHIGNNIAKMVDSLVFRGTLYEERPENPREGDMYLNRDTDQTFCFVDGDWHLMIAADEHSRTIVGSPDEGYM